MIKNPWRSSVIVTVTGLMLSSPALAQINKEHVDKAPKEDHVPMPHLDPNNPEVISFVKENLDHTTLWMANVRLTVLP